LKKRSWLKLALYTVVHEGVVVAQGTDHLVFFQEGHQLLDRNLTVDEPPDGPKSEFAVTQGDITGLFDLVTAMLL
jgi:hypothetical protein